MNNQYVTIYEEYKHKFFQLPQVFFVSDKYKDMSNNAKVAWAILRDRSALSRKNKWFDKDTGRIYFVFKNDELMTMLNIGSRTTMAKIKKELEDTGLIEIVKQGLNRPNKMYLLYPEVNIDDVYKIDEFDNYTLAADEAATENNEKMRSSLEPQGSPLSGRPKNGPPDVQIMNPSNTDLSNTVKKIDKRLDTIDTETDSSEIPLDEDSMSEKDKFIVDAFFRNNKIPPYLAQCLKVFSQTLEEVEYYAGIIFRAKNAVEKELGMLITLEESSELEQVVADSFSRAIRKIQKGAKVKNSEAYIYTAVRTAILEHCRPNYRRIQDERTEEPDNHTNSTKRVPLYDWLNERDQ